MLQLGIRKSTKTHLMMLEGDFFDFSRKISGLRYDTLVSYHCRVKQYPLNVFVISEEVQGPFWELLLRLKHKPLPCLESPLGYLPTVDLSPFATTDARYGKLDGLVALSKQWGCDAHFVRSLEDEVQGVRARDAFFQGYSKQRYISHVRIHHWVAMGLGYRAPAVNTILRNYVEVVPEDFFALPCERQSAIVVEEAIALGIERHVVKMAAETDISIDGLLDNFFHFHDNNPAYFRLKELATPGVIGDNPDWLATWSNTHFKSLKADLGKALRHLQCNIPSSLYAYLLALRNVQKSTSCLTGGDFRLFSRKTSGVLGDLNPMSRVSNNT